MSTVESGYSEQSLATALFESMAEPVLLCDADLRILAVNEAATDFLGNAGEQLMGRLAGEVLPSTSPGRPTSSLSSSGRLEWRAELNGPSSAGRMVAVSGVQLNDRRSGARGWALTLRSIGQALDLPRFVGHSAVAQELLEFVSRIAASRAGSILLEGESGTGKELIAKRLHCLSSRAEAAFVPINCATLPDNLLETELFGYEKGAFTDARETRKGLLETAHTGTLFLDEIGELSIPLQAKLLRVLEDHTFRRVGGNRDISVDLRVIGATNAELEKAIQERRFRNDLYYRLNVVQIRLPALRERPEDIADLVQYFLDHFNRLHHRHIRGVHPNALRLLESHQWPGNVRELRNVMERAVLIEASPMITQASLSIPGGRCSSPAKPVQAERPAGGPRLSLRSSEQELIAAALAEAAGNQTRAAGLLGIGRFSLRYKMKKFGML